MNNPSLFLTRAIWGYLLLPCCLLAQEQASLEESLTRAKVLHHAGAYGQSRLLYENALHSVDKDWQRDLLTYNIGSSLLAAGEPQAALDLWTSTAWAPSLSLWLMRLKLECGCRKDKPSHTCSN